MIWTPKPLRERMVAPRKQRGFIVNPYAFGGPAVDPYFANVSLLLHQDAIGSPATTFLDSSSNTHTVTEHGAAIQVSSPVKWDAGSGYFDGNSSTGSWLSVPSHTSLTLGSGDFTIEGWVRFASPTGGGTSTGTSRHVLFATDATGAAESSLKLEIEKLDDEYPPNFGNVRAAVEYNDASSDTTSGSVLRSFQIDTWYYWAMTRSGSTWEVRINGTLHATWTSAKTIRDRGGSFIVGATGGGWEGLKGYLDDFRVTKGVARDVSVIPSGSFPNSA